MLTGTARNSTIGPRQRSDALTKLTEREHAVLALMAAGRSNQAISDSLSVNPKTVETYVHRVFTKLGLLPASEDNRRVLAVLEYLSSRGGRPDRHRP